MVFTTAEREKLGVLVNNISIYGAQMVTRSSPDFAARALANLAAFQKEHEGLLKRVDEFARKHAEESPLRLIEDLARAPGDLAQMLTLVRRCLLSAGFLGHCIAQAPHTPTEPEALSREKRLH